MPVLQVYGSTETSPIAVYTRVGGDLSRNGSTGLPGLCCEARIVDENGREVPHGTAGEVVVRGPNVFFEYWGNAAATSEALRDGWYFSGDIGTRDADGYFSIHDRKKNMIISGGENIYPAEVERVLLEHPAIAEAAVIGRADPSWQEVPVAYVVRRPGRDRERRRDRAPCRRRSSRASRCRATSCSWMRCRATRSARCSTSCSGSRARRRNREQAQACTMHEAGRD